jgi:hypothetical protein
MSFLSQGSIQRAARFTSGNGATYARDPLSPPFHVNLVRGLRSCIRCSSLTLRGFACRGENQTPPGPLTAIAALSAKSYSHNCTRVHRHLCTTRKAPSDAPQAAGMNTGLYGGARRNGPEFLLLGKRKEGNLHSHPASAITTLIAVPGCWLYIVRATCRGSEPRTFWASYGYAFILEAAVASALVYLSRNQSNSRGTLVFTLHYIFWVGLVLRDRNWLAPVAVSIPLSPVFPCSRFAWLRYVQAGCQRRNLNGVPQPSAAP